MSQKMNKADKRKRVMFSIDPEVYRQVVAEAAENHISASRYVEIVLRASIAAKTMPVQGVIKGILEQLIESDRDLDRIDKEKAREALLSEK